MRFLRSLHLALLGATLPCVAQTHVCMGGDLDHLTQTEVSACQAKMTQVREVVRRHGAPANWHFVVVCDETGWSDVAGFTGKGAALRNVDYSSDGDLHWTFLRGSHLDADNSTATTLSAALKSLPGRNGTPGFEARPIPNPQRTIHLPAIQVADASTPVPVEEAAGQ